MAEQEQIERLRRSVLEWNEWRRQQPEIRPNLSDAFLLNADLNHADLRDAYLIGTDLSLADLSNADLSGASLRYTNLTEAYLRDANLTGASLNFANLSNADLTGANLNQARLGYTIFAWVDLSTINGLETVTHEGPSSIDVITVKLPQKETRTRLLRGAGIPESFIDSS